MTDGFSGPQARASVQALHAYVPPLEGRRQKIRLDFNENTLGFPEHFPELDPSHLLAYPEYADLVSALAQHLGLPEERLLITNGSDEGLFVAAFTFTEARDRALVQAPTFALIPHSLRLCDAELVEVGVTPELQADLERLESALASGIKIAMFASPDNPTGATLPLETLETWLQTYPHTLFVIDEAYFEYHRQSALPWVAAAQPPVNLVVSRTFSKAWGMAGLRLGLLAGHPQLIEWMRRVRSPYSVNTVAAKALLRFLPHAHGVLAQAEAAMERKARTIAQVQRFGYRVSAGQGNFFLLWVWLLSRQLAAFLAARGVLVRDRSSLFRMGGSVRVSVGSEQEMEQFLQGLREFNRVHGLIFDLDDTLVDTSRSYDVCVQQLSGCTRQELLDLRAEGGFNDDWVAAGELLRRGGRPLPQDEVVARGKALYAQVALREETALFQPEWFGHWSSRHPLFVYTGRPRDEYDPVWGDRLKGHFQGVLCQGDQPLPSKPAPDGLRYLLAEHGLQGGIYVGNSVDDMAAAKAAGLVAVGVTTNQSGETLAAAGADVIIERLSQLSGLMLLSQEES